MPSPSSPGNVVSSSTSLIGGCVSGVITTVATQPLDVIRTEMQKTPTKQRLNTWTACCNVVHRHGWKGLWNGMVPSVLRVGTGMGIYFFCLNHLHVPVVMQSNGGVQTQNSFTIFSVGFVARGLAAAVVMPFTVVKTRAEKKLMGMVSFEAGDRWYGNGILQTLRGIAQAEHPSALFRGFLPTLLRDSPFSGVYLLLYSKSKAAIEPLDFAHRVPRPALNFCIGAFSGVFATILTNPPDVVRTRMQLRNTEGGGGMGIMQVVRSMYRNEGVRAFFHLGVLPRVVKRSVQVTVA